MEAYSWYVTLYTLVTSTLDGRAVTALTPKKRPPVSIGESPFRAP
jgi:hypothetical protein